MGAAFKIAVAVLVLLYSQLAFSQQLRLGKNPYTVEKSAVLELYSDNQGLLLPRIVDTSLINVMNPPDGMFIYFSPTKQVMIRANGYWQKITTTGSVVTSLNGNTGALTMDTGYISNFYLKVRGLHSATAPVNYNSSTGVIGISQAATSTDGYLSSTDWNTFNNKLSSVDTTNISNFSIKVRSLFSGTAPITYSNGLIGITQATTSTNGYLSNTDWNTFNSKANSFTSGNLTETGSGVLTITGGTGSVIGTGTSIQVKQAGTSQNGFLSSTDWNTFNNKLSSIDTTNISNFSIKVRSLFSGTAPITYSNGLIGISQATTSTNGYLSSTDWNTFNSKGSGTVTSVSVVSANGVSGAVANPTTTPAITLTLGAITPTSVAATGTVTGSNLSGTNTGNVTLGTANGLSLSGQALSLGLASTSTTGALSSTDWNTFNNKLTSIDTTNISNFSVKVRSLFSGTAPITYSNGLIGISQATTSTNGYLSSTDWNTFNSKLSSIDTTNISSFSVKVRSLFSGTAPITYSNGLIGISQATTSTNGYLSSTDWNTFNSKGSGSVTSVSVVSANGVSGSVANPTTTPAITLTLGAITPTSVAATGTVTGSNLSGTNTGNVTIGTANGLSLSGQALSLGLASTSTTGALSSTDWNTFNNKLSSIDTTNISNFSVKVRSLFSGTAPITYSNGLIGITQATTSTNGYLSSTDWNIFNNKANSFTSGNLTETGSGVLTITGGTGSVIGTGTSIQVKQAGTSQNGFLSSTDWNTFNNKLSSIDTTNISNFSVKVRSLFSGTAPITYSNGLIGISQATTSTNGYLSSTDWNTFNSKGSGTVTSVSVVSANGVSGAVANPTTTPAITLTLGAITPTSVAATGTVTGSNLSGTNTGNVTIGTANGLSLSGQALSLGLASTSTTGALSNTDWNIFNNKLSSIDTTNISNFSVKVRSLFSGTAPITYSNGLIGISQATTSTNGYLNSTDWNTFNSKGSGTVTSVSVVSANGVSGTVANPTTTPAVTLTLGAITPTSVAATGTVTGSNLSGTNTGNVTIGTANGLSLSGQALSLGVASTSTTGALSNTDWNTFNNKPSNSSVWLLNGNAGTSPSTNFVGTTDNQDLVFKTNNTEWARIVSSSGDIKIGSSTSGTIRATDELVLRQDGDTYGSSILRLRNRTAENGAIYETTDPTTTLVDFIFKTAASQRNIRYEARSTYARAGTPSFHIGGSSPDNPTLAVGDSYAAFNTNLKIGNYNTPSEALDVTGNIRFSGAFMPNNLAGTSGQVLSSSGTGTAPTWTNFQLSNLNDVTLASPSNGQFLKYNGTNWVNTTGNYLTDPGGNGIIARTALNTLINRTITGTTNKITVTNGDGVSGNPVITVGSDIVDETIANTYTSGAKQTFANSATTSGVNLTPSADPSTLASGDFWNSTTTANSLKYRDASSTTRTLADLSLSQTFTNKTLTGSTNILGGVTMTLGSDATGDIYYRNSSGILTRFGIGTAGQFLSVSGGLPSWSSSTVAAHNLLSVNHPDVTAATVQRGDIITGQGVSAKWTRLGIGSQGTLLQAGATEVGYTSFKLPTSVGTAGQQLRANGTDYVNKTTTTLQSTPADPGTTTSTVGVMMGLGASVTPSYSGTFMIVISGDMDNATGGEGTATQIRYGTGTAPVHGAALTGTTVGSKIQMGQNNKNVTTPFTCNAIVSGLTVGTTYWIDLSLAATGGTARMGDISISVVEL